MEHIVNEFKRQQVGPQDFELTVPGLGFNEASGLIRNHESVPTAVAHIFDSLGSGLLAERLRRRASNTEFITRVPHFIVKNPSEVQYYYEKFLAEGYEGLVWKSLDHEYEYRRSWHWQRLVPATSIDVKVIAFYEGNGKLKGKVGGFYFHFNDQVCKCGTMFGIAEDERVAMWENQDYYKQLTAIVEFKELQPSGQPRQARFKGWRDDK